MPARCVRVRVGTGAVIVSDGSQRCLACLVSDGIVALDTGGSAPASVPYPVPDSPAVICVDGQTFGSFFFARGNVSLATAG